MTTQIVKPEYVLSIKDDDAVRIIDARSGADIDAVFKAGHLQYAVHVNLETELAQKSSNAAFGGRHPLPPIQTFAELLGRIGIQPETKVFVYDDKNGANAAARFWWMLKAAGHASVQVMDGGYAAAVKAGFPVSQEIIQIPDMGAYPVTEWQNPTADIDTMDAAIENKKTLIIDVREAYRYKGESEPIDLVAGHIPNAINLPYLENLDADGNFLDANALAGKYEKIIQRYQPDEIIVHCGSGVTACHTLLALEQAGITGSKIYVGSWSEWSRRGRQIITETDIPE